MPPKKRRRPHGTGGIYYSSSEKRWRGTIEAGWSSGGKRRRVVVSGATAADVERKLRDKRRELEGSRGSEPASPGATTVQDYAEEWLERAWHRVRPFSFNADRSAINNWILPVVGYKRLQDLTPRDMRAIAEAQSAAGRASSTALRTHATLMKMLKDAMLDGHRVPYRLRHVQPPRASKSDRSAIPIPAALAVLAEARRLPHGSRWVAALLHGLRQGEALGLTWDAVTLDDAIPPNGHFLAVAAVALP